MQYVGSGLNEDHGLRNHLYLIPENLDQKDMVAFACVDELHFKVENKLEILLGDWDFLYLSVGKESSDSEMPRNTVIVKLNGAGDENDSIDQ